MQPKKSALKSKPEKTLSPKEWKKFEIARIKKRLEETAKEYYGQVDGVDICWEEMRNYLDDANDLGYIPSPEMDSWITEMQLIWDLLKIKCHQLNDCLLSLHKQ